MLDSVCIDRWEASLVEKQEDGGEKPWSPFHAPTGAMKRVRAISKPGVVPQGYISGAQASAACEASGKRLCTTYEWEAACRAGDPRERYDDELERIAWFAGNAEGTGPQRVGIKAPNALGLYDTLGNVWEWCDDGTVVGGSWRSAKEDVTATSRKSPETRKADDIGFRLVFEFDEP